MTTAFQRNAFQFGAFQIAGVTRPDGGGLRHALERAEFEGYLDRRQARLDRQKARQERHVEVRQPEEVAEVIEAAPDVPAPLDASPLPIMMDFGQGPVVMGMRAASLTEAMQRMNEIDEDDALEAILLSS